MTNSEKRILKSKEEIMEFFDIKDAIFAQFLKIQIPVIIINGRYFAHSENLDAWFKSLTAKQRAEITVPETPKA